MRKKIPAERYWELRAKQMEIALVEERKKTAHVARTGLAAVGKMLDVLRSVDGILAAYADDSAGLGQAIRQDAAALITAIGLGVGLEGEPATWEVDMGAGPDSAAIYVKEATTQ